MDPSARYRINSPHITHETIDGEVVIINFESGSYYSLNSSGADIWGLIDRQASLGQIAAALTSRYEGDRDEVEQVLERLIIRLGDESLIVAAETPSESGAPPAAVTASTERTPFAAPKLEKYDDMQALLLLDPIHEVDETGWPVAKPDSLN